MRIIVAESGSMDQNQQAAPCARVTKHFITRCHIEGRGPLFNELRAAVSRALRAFIRATVGSTRCRAGERLKRRGRRGTSAKRAFDYYYIAVSFLDRLWRYNISITAVPAAAAAKKAG